MRNRKYLKEYRYMSTSCISKTVMEKLSVKKRILKNDGCDMNAIVE
jgi:hypothetical protein